MGTVGMQVYLVLTVPFLETLGSNVKVIGSDDSRGAWGDVGCGCGLNVGFTSIVGNIGIKC